MKKQDNKCCKKCGVCLIFDTEDTLCHDCLGCYGNLGDNKILKKIKQAKNE